MKKLFRTKMLPFLLTLSLVTNGAAPGLVQPSTVYAAEAPSGTTAAAESAAAQTKTADVVLKNGGIEIDGQFYTDVEFKTLLENAKIVRIPFDSESGRRMVEEAMLSGLVINTAVLAALGIAVAGVFTALAVYMALSSLADKAYQVITGNGKVYDFRFMNDGLFINNTYVSAFTSTIAVITSFFDDHLTANPNEEVTDPDAGTGDVDKPGEGDSEAAIEEAVNSISDKKKQHILQDKHNWNRLVPNPNAPNNWQKVAAFISLTLSEGKEEPYGSAFQKVLIWGEEIIVVTYQYVDSILRISDAWVVK